MKETTPLSIDALRKAYERGENPIERLSPSEPSLERSEVIELAYDIQAGSYTQGALAKPERLRNYAREIHGLSASHLRADDVVLDCGAGELTTLSALSHHLPAETRLLACDISLSRLRAGRRFAEQFMYRDLQQDLKLFVADMVRIPLANSSMDVVLTVHALEPNHGRERELLIELLRVSRHTLILFEPSWEHASDEVRQRMSRHGYVRDLPQHIDDAGGRLVAVNPLPNPLNPMNPTFCYVVKPIEKKHKPQAISNIYRCPRSGAPLEKREAYWWSAKGGWWGSPEIDGIPCLRVQHGVLMSHA